MVTQKGSDQSWRSEQGPKQHGSKVLFMCKLEQTYLPP
jgi:hypothetical protein